MVLYTFALLVRNSKMGKELLLHTTVSVYNQIPTNKMTTYNQNSDFLSQLKIEPVTQKNWNKFVKLFGDKIIEAYPTIPTQDKIPDSFAWIGLFKSFERAGFEIVDRTSKNRPMVRYYIENDNNT